MALGHNCSKQDIVVSAQQARFWSALSIETSWLLLYPHVLLLIDPDT
jgi:hypothetical protein